MTRQMEPLEKEPSWLMSRADNLATHLRNAVPAFGVSHLDVIIMPLDEPPEWANDEYRQKFDKKCSRCSNEATFFGNVERQAHGKKVIIFFGACDECLSLP